MTTRYKPGPGLHETEAVLETDVEGEGDTVGRRRDPEPLGPVRAGPAPARAPCGPGCRSSGPTSRGRRPRATPRRRGHRGSPSAHAALGIDAPRARARPIGPSLATGHWRSDVAHGSHLRANAERARCRRDFTVPSATPRSRAASASLNPSTSRRTRMARCSGARPASVALTSTTVATSTGATERARERGGVDGLLAAAPGDADRLSDRDASHPAVQGGGLAQ